MTDTNDTNDTMVPGKAIESALRRLHAYKNYALTELQWNTTRRNTMQLDQIVEALEKASALLNNDGTHQWGISGATHCGYETTIYTKHIIHPHVTLTAKSGYIDGEGDTPTTSAINALTNAHEVWETTPAGYLDTLGIVDNEITATFGPTRGSCSGNRCTNPTTIQIEYVLLSGRVPATLEQPEDWLHAHDHTFGVCDNCAKFELDHLDDLPREQGIVITVQEPA